MSTDTDARPAPVAVLRTRTPAAPARRLRLLHLQERDVQRAALLHARVTGRRR